MRNIEIQGLAGQVGPVVGRVAHLGQPAAGGLLLQHMLKQQGPEQGARLAGSPAAAQHLALPGRRQPGQMGTEDLGGQRLRKGRVPQLNHQGRPGGF